MVNQNGKIILREVIFGIFSDVSNTQKLPGNYPDPALKTSNLPGLVHPLNVCSNLYLILFQKENHLFQMTAIEDPEVFCKQLLNELNESNETILGISENLTGSNETIFGTSENQTGPNPCEFRK